MTQHEASRTLVKSPPELWAECSDAASLGRHLGAFGELRITHLEPETTVAWEGGAASGTVRLEPSGWGTRVTLTATLSEPEAAPDPDPEPAAEGPPARGNPRPRSILDRIRALFRRTRVAIAEEVAAARDPDPEQPAPTPEQPAPTPEQPAPTPEAALTAALDSLGQAHHRPFSRA